MAVVVVPLLEVSDEMDQLWNVYYVCIGTHRVVLKKSYIFFNNSRNLHVAHLR